MELVTQASTTTAGIEVVEATEGLYRVRWSDETIGYVQRVGRVFVSLHGRVYNTAVEVGQSLEFSAAIDRVVRG